MDTLALNGNPGSKGISSSAASCRTVSAGAQEGGHSVRILPGMLRLSRLKGAFLVAAVLSLCLVIAGCSAPVPNGQPAGAPAEAADAGLARDEAPADEAKGEGAAGAMGEASSAGTVYASANGETLSIELAGNSSAQAFASLLSRGPITIEMQDYGGFEKVGPLGTRLVTNDASITTEPGDVILYEGDKVTIYYGTNSWRFTRLGRIQSASQDSLRTLLGDGGVSVTFSLE